MKSSGELYVAVRAHLLSECGRGLQRVLSELKSLGRCVVGDGLKDALSIALDASGRTIVLLGCREDESVERAEVAVIEPYSFDAESWKRVSEDLWLGLSGEVSVDGVAGALRVFTDKPFITVALSAGSEERARELAVRVLEELCLREED